MKKFLFTNFVVPRWVILIVDSIIYFASYLIALLLVLDFNTEAVLQESSLIHASYYLGISLTWYLYFHLHTGLLRYSNTTDIFRIIKSNLFAHISIFAILIIANSLFISNKLYPFKELGIAFFISTSALISLRILVKGMFISYYKRSHHKDQTPVLIYGSGSEAVMMKNALENLDQHPFEIVGFIDHHKSMAQNYIEQIKVHHFLEVGKLKEKYNDLQIILSNEDLNIRPKKLLVDLALRYNINIITIPPAEAWIAGRNISATDIKRLRIEDLLQRAPIQIDDSSISDFIKNKRILVTGAAGSIGFEIALQVCKYTPSQVILCDIGESALHEAHLHLQDLEISTPLEVAVADIRNQTRMVQLFDLFKPEIVFHAAAYKHVPLMENNPYEAIMTNVRGTQILADLSVEYQVEKFVMISTDKAVNPTNIMGASKRIAEMYVQSLHQKQIASKTSNITQFVTTRFGNVLGSNGSVIPRFRQQIEKGGPLTVTHPEITRYFMTISEAVQLVLQAGSLGNGGEIYVFDMGAPVKLYDMALQMIKLSGLKPEVDIKIVFTGLRPGEKLYEELLNDDENTLPTPHEKIRVASIRPCSHEVISHQIDTLMELTHQHVNVDMVRQMKVIVPEFISQNSIYSQLDSTSV